MFKTIPPVIFKLVNLQELTIKSVELEECADDKIYEALPKLSSLDVSHNNLKVIPRSTFNGRNIDVISFDNPAYGLITLNSDTLGYRWDRCWSYTFRGVYFPFKCLFQGLSQAHLYGVNTFKQLADGYDAYFFPSNGEEIH